MNDRALVGRPLWSHLLLLSVILRPALICAHPAPVAQKVKKITSAVANTINAVANTINAAANTINAGAVFFFASFGYIGTLLKYKVTLDISSNNNWQLFLSRICRRWRPFYQNLPIAKIAMPGFQLLRLISDPLTF